MLAWIIVIIFSAVCMVTITAICYEVLPLRHAIATSKRVQRTLLYFVVIYPLAYILLLFPAGNLIYIPNTKYQIPSFFVFVTCHILLSVLATSASLYLSGHNKRHIPFVISNSLAGTLYIAITFVMILEKP